MLGDSLGETEALIDGETLKLALLLSDGETDADGDGDIDELGPPSANETAITP